MIDETTHSQAERWLGALEAHWGNFSELELHRPVWRVRRALAAGIDEWAHGSREELIYAAAARGGPHDRQAFLTLACKVWPEDFTSGENFWLLPYQLAFVYAGIDLEPNGLPAGVNINDLPVPIVDRIDFATVGAGPEGPAPSASTTGRRRVQAAG